MGILEGGLFRRSRRSVNNWHRVRLRRYGPTTCVYYRAGYCSHIYRRNYFIIHHVCALHTSTLHTFFSISMPCKVYTPHFYCYLGENPTVLNLLYIALYTLHPDSRMKRSIQVPYELPKIQPGRGSIKNRQLL